MAALAVSETLSRAFLAALDFLDGDGFYALLARRHEADPVGFETRVADSAA
jgi:hypothetical protein